MRAVAVTLVLVAWGAFVLPWQRCHDRLLPILGEHRCHAHDDDPGHDDHGGHAHEHVDPDAGCCGDHDGAGHEAVSFDSLRPEGGDPGLASPVALDGPVPDPRAAAEGALLAIVVPRARSACTTVLLL